MEVWRCVFFILYFIFMFLPRRLALRYLERLVFSMLNLVYLDYELTTSD